MARLFPPKEHATRDIASKPLSEVIDPSLQLNDEEFDHLEYFVKNKEKLITEHKERITQLTTHENTSEETNLTVEDEESSSEYEEEQTKEQKEVKANFLSKNKRRKLKKKRRRKELTEKGLPVPKYH